MNHQYMFQRLLSDQFMQTTHDFGTEVGIWDEILDKQGWAKIGAVPTDEDPELGVSAHLYRYRDEDKAPGVGKFLVDVVLFDESLMSIFCQSPADLLVLLRDWIRPLVERRT
jgi:hypothetical protein